MTSLRKLLAACSVSIEFADQEKCRASPERSQGKRERPSRCQSEAWVQANFKETELTNTRVRDTADVRVDTFPRRVFRRKVEQLSPASSSQLALLPPDNATGNFTWLRNNGPIRVCRTSAIAEIMRESVTHRYSRGSRWNTDILGGRGAPTLQRWPFQCQAGESPEPRQSRILQPLPSEGQWKPLSQSRPLRVYECGAFPPQLSGRR